jgi:hypothetical protein
MAITKAAMAMPTEMANPIWLSVVPPARMSDAKVPARMRPAEAIVGPAWRTAIAAALRGSRPSRASSLSRDTIKML